MNVWVHGWDWGGWIILMVVWVFVLAAALHVTVKLTNGPRRHPR